MLVQRGEMGIPTILTAKTWGFYDVLFGGKPFKFQRPYGSYIMENVLWKISFPAEFHAQTAVESSLILHEYVRSGLDEISRRLTSLSSFSDLTVNSKLSVKLPPISSLLLSELKKPLFELSINLDLWLTSLIEITPFNTVRFQSSISIIKIGT
jgi:hypothetical protein